MDRESITHVVIYRPAYAHPWHVINLIADKTIGAFATQKTADDIAAMRNLRGAQPGTQVCNTRTEQVAHLVYVWPSHVEVILSTGSYRRWPFMHTRVIAQPTGTMPPVTPHAIHLLSAKGASHE